MLTPASVLTNKNSRWNRLPCLLFLAACCGILGCSPPGPRALLQGKAQLDTGEIPAAIESLEKAVFLLPGNALAWNYLGLAYHSGQKPEEAVRAYQKALSLDYKLTAVRYNLGCLHLDQGDYPAAVEELRKYTLLQPGIADGWLKLGAALSRAHKLDEAERSYRTALELHARHPEALNGLGMIQMQRRRHQEALNHFNAAAVQVPPHAPAVLNSAILQQQLGNRALALQRYRQYLTLGAGAAEATAVVAVVRQLEAELNPPALVARPAVVLPAASWARTNSSAAPSVGQRPATVAVAAPRTNPPVSASSPSIKPAPVRINPVKAAEAPASRPPEIEVTQVQPSAVIKPAQELNRAVPPAPEQAIVEVPAGSLRTSTNAPRRGLLARLNPFGTKSRTNTVAGAGQRIVKFRPQAGTSSGRYSYLSPAAPTAGDSAESEKAFKRGVKAQRAGSLPLAITEYQVAVKADPANYDAYYNLGLAALERGDSRLSLWAYEIALALKPEGEDARYNFALALKAGGYWEDAADQFQALVSIDPADVRAHLSLANLYAQQLQQPEQARGHYARVLELNPKHAEAAKIRYWLAANP